MLAPRGPIESGGDPEGARWRAGSQASKELAARTKLRTSNAGVAHWLAELERLARGGGRAAAGRRREGARAPARAGQADGARAGRGALRPGGALARARAVGGARGCTLEWGGAPGAGVVAGLGRIHGRDVHRGRRRRHREGRRQVPARHQEGAAGAGDRAREPAADRSTWSTRPASSCRCRTRSSPTASTTAGSSTTTPVSRPRASSRSAAIVGSCVAGGAYLPIMSRRDAHRRGDRLDLPRRLAPGAGGDRRARSTTRRSAAPWCRPTSRAWSTTATPTRPPASPRSARSSSSSPPRARAPFARARVRGPPAHDPEELLGLDAGRALEALRHPRAARAPARRLSEFDEFKATYGRTLVCGTGWIERLRRRHRRQPALDRRAADRARSRRRRSCRSAA